MPGLNSTLKIMLSALTISALFVLIAIGLLKPQLVSEGGTLVFVILMFAPFVLVPALAQAKLTASNVLAGDWGFSVGGLMVPSWCVETGVLSTGFFVALFFGDLVDAAVIGVYSIGLIWVRLRTDENRLSEWRLVAIASLFVFLTMSNKMAGYPAGRALEDGALFVLLGVLVLGWIIFNRTGAARAARTIAVSVVILVVPILELPGELLRQGVGQGYIKADRALYYTKIRLNQAYAWDLTTPTDSAVVIRLVQRPDGAYAQDANAPGGIANRHQTVRVPPLAVTICRRSGGA